MQHCILTPFAKCQIVIKVTCGHPGYDQASFRTTPVHRLPSSNPSIASVHYVNVAAGQHITVHATVHGDSSGIVGMTYHRGIWTPYGFPERKEGNDKVTKRIHPLQVPNGRIVLLWDREVLDEKPKPRGDLGWLAFSFHERGSDWKKKIVHVLHLRSEDYQESMGEMEPPRLVRRSLAPSPVPREVFEVENSPNRDDLAGEEIATEDHIERDERETREGSEVQAERLLLVLELEEARIEEQWLRLKKDTFGSKK